MPTPALGLLLLAAGSAHAFVPAACAPRARAAAGYHEMKVVSNLLTTSSAGFSGGKLPEEVLDHTVDDSAAAQQNRSAYRWRRVEQVLRDGFGDARSLNRHIHKAGDWFDYYMRLCRPWPKCRGTVRVLRNRSRLMSAPQPSVGG